MSIDQTIITIIGGVVYGVFTIGAWKTPAMVLAFRFLLLWALLILPHPLLVVTTGSPDALSLLGVLTLWWVLFTVPAMVVTFAWQRLRHP